MGEIVMKCLDGEQLFVHLLHGHAAAENRGHGQIAAVPRIAGRHHVLRVKQLCGQLRHGQGSRIKVYQS